MEREKEAPEKVMDSDGGITHDMMLRMVRDAPPRPMYRLPRNVIYQGKVERGENKAHIVVTVEINGYAVFVCGSQQRLLHKFLDSRDEALEYAVHAVVEFNKGYGWELESVIRESCRKEEDK